MSGTEKNFSDCAVTRLSLSNFRCYANANLVLPDAKQVVIFGNNGSGKTSLLEAISLLVSSRGMRQASQQEICTNHAANRWHVDSQVKICGLPYQLLTSGKVNEQPARCLEVNGKKKTFASLADKLQVVWLTPTLDRVLVESRTQRRNFVDHMVGHFDLQHKTCCRKYEKLQQQRLRLLLEDCPHSSWLTALERTMAELTVRIATSRVQWVSYIRQSLATSILGFPCFDLQIEGAAEQQILNGEKALRLEDDLTEKFHAHRSLDQQQARTTLGATKTDFLFTVKQLPLAQSSTGEQKVLLLSFILNIANLLKKHHHRAPIVLLDEVANNLDLNYREALFQALATSSSQIWLTGTDSEIFRQLRQQSLFLKIKKLDNSSQIEAQS